MGESPNNINSDTTRYPKHYASKDTIAKWIGLAISASVLMSGVVSYMLQNYAFPQLEGVKLSYSIGELSRNQAAITIRQEKILQELQLNSREILALRRDFVVLNRFGSSALRDMQLWLQERTAGDKKKRKKEPEIVGE